MWRRCAAVVLVAMALGACDDGDDGNVGGFGPRRRPSPAPTSSDSLVVGLVGTMTGPDAWRGEDAYEGADLGTHILNRTLGDGDAQYELATLDDKGDPVLAAELVRQLATSDRTVGIVYAGPPEALARSERVLAEAGIPGVLTYGDLYTPRALKPHVFQTSPPYVWQARRIVPYLFADRRYRRVGALIERSYDGDAAVAGLEGAVEGTSRRIDVARYDPRLGPDSAIDKLRDKQVEAVIVHGAPRALDLALRSLARSEARYRGTPAARIASARPRVQRMRERRDWWHPQVVGFDQLLHQRAVSPPPGTVAAETYARGVHYLPVPSFQTFRAAFSNWWDAEPVGWERRAYEATLMVGWAAERTERGGDAARSLERLRGRRFGGLPINLGPDDHTATEHVTVGLWTVPDPNAGVREQEDIPGGLQWVPLGRGFSIDGEVTDILSEDWAHLFKNPPPPDGPAPRIRRQLFGVTSSRRDTRH